MPHETDHDLARILRAVLDGIEPEMEPRAEGVEGTGVRLQASIPADLDRALRKICRREVGKGGRPRTMGFSVHVERAIRLYLRVLELASNPKASTK